MKKPVQSTTEKATLTTEITPQNFGTQVLSFARKTGIKVSAVLAFFALASCGSDTPIDEELNNRVQNNLTVTVGDFDNDGVKDDVRVKNVVTDLDKDDKISQTISLGDQSFQADARMLEKDFLNVPKGTAVAKAVSTDTKSEDTDRKTISVDDVDTTPNNLPTGTLTLNKFDENNVIGKDANGDDILATNTKVGDVIGSGTFTDADGDQMTLEETDPNFDAEITENTVNPTTGARTIKYNVKTTAALDTNYETGAVIPDFNIKANDGKGDSETITKKPGINDLDDLDSYVDRADVNYTETATVGGADVTEDLSHIDLANTKNAERIMSIADNDPNNENLQTQLRVSDDANGNEVWVNQQTRIDQLAATGLGTGTAANLAMAWANGGNGMENFRELTNAEIGANNGSYLENQHGEFVEGPSFKKAVQILKDEWNAEDNMYFDAPSTFAGAEQKIARKVRVWRLLLAKNLQKPGANVAANVLEAAVDSQAMADAMTENELAEYYAAHFNSTTTHPDFIASWGN